MTSLAERLATFGSAVEMLRTNDSPRYSFPGIPREFTNWRDEARAWSDGVALLEQSYHMTEAHVRGPGAIDFLRDVAVNKFDPFPTRRAKQIVAAAPDGSIIGDAIGFHEDPEFVRIVGIQILVDWLVYSAEQSPHDVTVTADPNWNVHRGDRDVFRLQIQGRLANDLIQDVTQQAAPQIKFFGIEELVIGGQTVRALGHGMSGTQGFEIYGPWESQQAVRSALEEAGQKYGLRKVGAEAYGITARETGWWAAPLPGIFSSPETRGYREWMKGASLLGSASLAGSFHSDRIEDYYLDPIELGYGGLIDWDRDFPARDALAERKSGQRRKKVTLVWNADDVTGAMRDSLYEGDERALYIELPLPHYGMWQYDSVLKDGNLVGVSGSQSFSPNIPGLISLAVVDIDAAEPGTEIVVLWGDPTTPRNSIERHSQREIRATVAPAPYISKSLKTR